MAQRSNKPKASALKQFREFACHDRREITGDGAPHFFGWTNLNGHGFPGGGVAVTPAQCMSNAVLRRCTGEGAVNEVAHHRMPHRSSVSSDLVGATRLDGPFHQRGAAVHGPTSRAKHLERGTAWFVVDGESATACGREANSAAPTVVLLDHGRPLGLKSRHHFRTPSHQHRPPRAVIQPVHRFGAFWKRWAARQEGAEVLAPAPVGGHSSRLQHDGMVVVKMQYVENAVQDGGGVALNVGIKRSF